MYRQVLVLPVYRKYQHIFWRISQYDKLVEYQLNTVTYGVTCAPFLTLRVFQAISMNDCSGQKTVRDVLLNQMYINDTCIGVDYIADALQLQSDLISLLDKAGLQLSKWSSYTPAVLEPVPSNHRVNGPLSLDTKDDGGTKAFGMQWLPSEDVFCCAL